MEELKVKQDCEKTNEKLNGKQAETDEERKWNKRRY